ncbi:MAG: ligase-associated DNA damage response endonuclease PdeM [Pseudomonadota bacterium]
MLTIELAGETMQLHHERAAFWSKNKCLIVADTHFGKDGVFRTHAIPIPDGIAQHDLKRLTKLIEETKAERLIVLGDFIHGYLDKTQPFIEQFNDWRMHHSALTIEVVLGNHDRSINPSHYQNIEWHEEKLEPPFYFMHEHNKNEQQHFILSGHIHPVIRLNSRGDRMRMPVFWFQHSHGVLPAFGSMTGGFNIKPTRQDRLYVIGDDEVMALT